MRIRNSLVPLVLAVVAAACGSSGMNHAGSPTNMTSGSPGPTAGKTVDVVMKDISFSPDRLNVRQGDTVTFRFTNTGASLHEAVIGNEDAQAQAEKAMQQGGHQGMNMMVNTVEVPPGQTGQLTVTFDKTGDFLIGCHEPGHYAAGMRATVSVRS